LPSGNKRGRPANRPERAHRAVDAAGYVLLRLGEKRFRPGLLHKGLVGEKVLTPVTGLEQIPYAPVGCFSPGFDSANGHHPDYIVNVIN
jgi:hypothetical protein